MSEPPATTLGDAGDVLARLGEVARDLARQYPGAGGRRQAVHTVYGGAHLFAADSAAKLGALALRALSAYAPDAAAFAAALGVEPALMATVYPRVAAKLEHEPVEDFRIDFEDGYGVRPDGEEDGHAAGAAREVAAGLERGTLPAAVGIRIKPFSAELAARSLRTLDLFVTTLCRATGGGLPDGFVVTLPKVMAPEQPAALAEVLGRLERGLSLAAGALRLELMIETPQSILDPSGRAGVRRLVEAADGRCAAAHFGTYDYTALCEITAAYQEMTHPACDFAKQVMQVALAGSGVQLSDGSTNILPVAPHRPRDGAALTAEQSDENRRAVHAAWRLHYGHVRRSLVQGYYQGWDLHPAQLPTRYAAVYAFFLEGLDAASERLRNFLAKAAQATLVGDVFDDAATGQ
ncbi:MAG TPA: phosphoenolpyruvate kinase, partial [Thermoanaerobaculia bacterium]|nr:phosphoenolpyruvate kinase [Thermoanaerobaculia bacterium]